MGILAALDYEDVTVQAVAKGLTGTKLAGQGITEVEITVEGGPIRFLKNGAAPTGAVGHHKLEGDVIPLTIHEAAQFKAIRASDALGDATLRVTYRGPR